MSKFRVMVVDDDPDIRFVVTALLATEFETTQAQNGLDALEKIDRYQPDVLLMDVMMPVMNGIECCRVIQQTFDGENLPVFYLSARDNKDIKKAAMNVGGVAFIEKPFDTADLIKSIKSHLAETGAQPRHKDFSPEEIEAIDSKPLEGAEVDDVEEPAIVDLTSDQDLDQIRSKPARTRRVFGKQKSRETSGDEDTASDAGIEPSRLEYDKPIVRNPALEVHAPQPDYRSISKEFTKQADNLKERLRSKESSEENKKPAIDSRAETLHDGSSDNLPSHQPVPPPKPQPVEEPESKEIKKPTHREFRPVAPAPPAARSTPKKSAQEEQPSAAEILAQRRLGALGKKVQRGTAKPRVLVIINNSPDVETFHAALAGLAEFLPLEDPVAAVALIARFQPDIVMMGIHEKNFSGIQLAGMLRTNNRLAHVQPIFINGFQVESQHLSTARNLSPHDIVRIPLSKDQIRSTVEKVINKPGFKVREKKLSYGIYVNEVIRSADDMRRKDNKQREKASLREGMHDMISFMAKELKDYKEPKGLEELKGVGNKVHHVR